MRNLAFLAQGSGGVAESDRRAIVLPQVIIESAMFFQEDGHGKNIQISLTDRVTQNKIQGHPELIRQVLMNIFDNCIKYGTRDSIITVNQRIRAKSSTAVIEISGVSQYPVRPEDLEKICDLGFRGSNAQKTLASGTGLGLFICKKIIEDHKGRLHIQANGSNGIIFTVTLPVGNVR